MKLVIQIAAGVLIALIAEKLLELAAGALILTSAVQALDMSLPKLPRLESPGHQVTAQTYTRPTRQSQSSDPLPPRKRCQITKPDGTTTFCSGPLTDGQ